MIPHAHTSRSSTETPGLRAPHHVVWLLMLVAIFVAPLLMHAQPATPKPPAKLRFLFLDETAGAYAVKLGNDYRQISSTPYAISPVFTPPNGSPLEIYKTNPIADPAGKITRVRIATVTPPTNTTSALIIITPRPAPADSTTGPIYNVEFIDNDPQTYPVGSMRVLNRGQALMAAQLGAEQIVVQPGATQVVTPNTDRRHRVLIKVAAQSPEKWELLTDSIAVIRAKERVTGIFFYSPSGMRHFYTPEEIEENGPPLPGHFWLTYSDFL